MIRLDAIKPNRKKLDFTRYVEATKFGLREAAEGALEDFEKTTATWDIDVAFGMKPYGDGYTVGPVGGATDIYGYVDKGTRAHEIIARRAKRLRFASGYRAKTRPGFIGSQGGGSSGSPVFRRRVWHPGSKGRGFSKLIKAKWQAKTPALIQRRIREAA